MESCEKYTLENGLTVLLQQSIGQPVVAMHLWVNAGSACEIPSQAGIAHCIEHLLFKGTKTRSAKALNQAVESHGGILNAFTSFDNTGYHITLPKRHVGFGLDVLRELLLKPRFARADFMTERQVILEEMREELDNPEAVLGHRLFRAAFANHPYQRPIIGLPETLKRMSIAKVRAFYNQAYRPQNMILAIAGDCDLGMLRKAVAQRFARFRPRQASPANPLPPTIDRSQQRFSLGWLRMGQSQEALELGFSVPPISHPHTAALDLLATILGGSEHSRLYRRLCERHDLARAVDAHCFSAKHGGLLLMRAVLNDQSYHAAYMAILDELKRLRERPVEARELELAKLSIEKDLLFEGETCDGLAHNLAFYQTTIGDAVWGSHYYDTVMACSAAELQRTAIEYFQASTLTVMGLSPKAIAPPLSSRRWPNLANRALQSKPLEKGRRHARQITQKKLDENMRLLHRHIPHSQVTSVNIAIPGGLLWESAEQSGIGHLALNLLNKGTRQRNERQLSQALTDLGAEFDASIGRSRIGLQLDLPTRHLKRGIALLGELLHQSKISEQLFRRERDFVKRELASQDDQFELQGFNRFMANVFPLHPYGSNPLGSIASLRQFTLAQVQHFFRSKLLAAPWSIATVGGVSLKETSDLLQRYLRPPQRLATTPAPTLRPVRSGLERLAITGKQAYLYHGYRTCSLYDSRWPVLDVLSGLLTGFGGGLLYHRLREELGLAYTVQCYAYSGSIAGYFCFYVNTAPANVERVLKEIHQTLDQLANRSVAPAQLKRAKSFLLGAYLSELQRTAAQAHHLATYHQYGLASDLDYYSQQIQAVTGRQITQVVSSFMRDGQGVSVVSAPR